MRPLAAPVQAHSCDNCCMRNALLAVALLAAGCTGGGDDSREEPRDADPSATITSGIYDVSHFERYSDGCDLDPSAEEFVAVTVSGNDVTVEDIDLSLSAGILSGVDLQSDVDLLGGGVCTGDVTQAVDGTVPENDQIDVVNAITVSNPQGTCDALPVDLPCTTEIFFRLTKQ